MLDREVLREKPLCFEREVFPASHNDVIVQVDTKNPTALDEAFRHTSVCIGWLWITAGVVMHQDDGIGTTHNGGAKYFSRLRHSLAR